MRPGKRATVGLTAILMVLPNAFWKGESSNRVQIRVEVTAAEMSQAGTDGPVDAIDQPAERR